MDGGWVDATNLLSGEHPKFTLTEHETLERVPMHEATQTLDESPEKRALRAAAAVLVASVGALFLVTLAYLLTSCAAPAYGPVKFGWRGELSAPLGAECLGKTKCDLYWCPAPCVVDMSTAPDAAKNKDDEDF